MHMNLLKHRIKNSKLLINYISFIPLKQLQYQGVNCIF
ncbi:hypothetical protein SAMN05444955_10231 [Lihuaxuella thermophila]|uniref:Uncharacterized protein n=1 Tax=Lihuaxuella thermophila TaxID=1173111 RepID=A0A1H8B9J7_9BACL|nr:hypothetical protein SAMN05444955_10231 [Lihuaxuella thermophila]